MAATSAHITIPGSLESYILQCTDKCNRIPGLLAEGSDSVADGEGVVLESISR